MDAEAEEAARILGIVEAMNGIEDADALLDQLAEQAARVAGYGAGLLSLALPEGAMVGTWGIPEEDRLRFKKRATRTAIDYRVEKRRRIRAHCFPGTGIAYVPRDVDLDRAPLSEDYFGRPRIQGSWDPKDRLFILVSGAGGREIGIFSLDFPEDGNAPDPGSLDRLRLAERLLAIGGILLQERLLERSLRRSEEEMRALVEDAPVGIYRRQVEGPLVSANQRLASILGFRSPADLLADGSLSARIEPPEVAGALSALGDGEEMLPREFEAVRRDGTRVRLRVSARRLPGREHLLGIVEDVTSATDLARHLQRVRRLEAVGTLASGIAHDFNNLLCSILGYASLLRLEGTAAPGALAAAGHIEEAAERGADLTRRLLGIARESPGESASVDVAAVLADCARLARETFDRRIDVRLETGEDLPPVRGRANDLHQAVLNLCINARDAMPSGGVLRLSALRDAAGPRRPPAGDPPAAWVRLEVADEGEGMSPEVLSRIFEPFFTTKQRGKGTGLGLFMVFQSVQSHGGVLEVDSEPGKGTRFRVFLPAAEGPAEAASREASPPGERARPAKILLVEDEAMILDLAAGYLRSRGHAIVTASDGTAAIALLEAPGAAFDLAVLDLVLPGASGLDVYRRLRARFPALPVILSSGNLEDAALDPGLRAGLAGILAKPFRPSELAAAVDAALRRAPAPP